VAARIGITLGDPAGIGPEVTEAAVAALPPGVETVLFGPAPLVARIAAGRPSVLAKATTADLAGVEPGRYTAASGAASISALRAGVSDLASGAIGALVTGPICKAAIVEAGLRFPGQTELVAEGLGVRRFAMMLAGPRLRVTLATTHLALREVTDAVTGDRVADAAELTAAFLKEFEGIAHPRIGVLGLNPHASDHGRFGDEDLRVIAPAVSRLVAAGLDATGPLPADTAFHRAVNGEFDALVAMYHDQGLGPLKLIHFSDAINVTLGLPRVRCSPDHGPAFDLAGSGRADPASMTAAARFAARAAGGRVAG
jgi:4-hydroxythreonine-4-phosphate dehydrogenase